MNTVLRSIAVAAAMAASVGSASAFSFTDPPTGSAVVLTPGGPAAVRSITTSGSPEEVFTFFWSGADATISLTSSADPATGYRFDTWRLGTGTDWLAPGTTFASGTGPSFGPIQLLSGVRSSGDYYFTFTGIDNANSVTSTLTLTPVGQVTAVPEPSTYALMLGGLGVVGFLARRRSARAVADRRLAAA
jgi:hypothetical protein